jgi:hypothetical protein
MTEQEKRVIAHRLADGSRFVSFERALQLVELKPEKAERLVQDQEECNERQEERSRIFRQLRDAARELV